MSRKLALLSLVSSFALSVGCVVVSDDDDTGNDTGADDGADDNNATAADDDGMDTAADDSMDTAADDGMDTAADDGMDTAADTAADDADTAADESGGDSLCGWGEINEKEVMDGYICGGMGADPKGAVAMDCPDIELMAGGACGEITGQGCCMGDTVWFCANGQDGADDSLVMQACE